MSDGYRKERIINGNLGGSLVVATGTGDTTLITCKTNHTIYLQRLHIHLTTGSSGKTWSVEDTNSSAVTVTGNIPTDTAPLDVELDFGPTGLALTAGKNLVLNVSAAGAAGIVTWDAYQKLTTVAAA